MPSVSRPDLLPFALPKRIGLPYHGPIIGNKMTLPNAAQMTYPQPNDGSTILVEAPGAAAPALSADDVAALTARGQQWLTYAYLSGKDHDIGGQSLGANRWLYCDGNRTWLMRWERNYVSAAPETSTFDIYVEALFGYFGQTEYTTINRKIYSYSTKSDALTMPGIDYEHYWLLAPGISQPIAYYSETGGKLLVNLIDTWDASAFGYMPYYSYATPPIPGTEITAVELWETFTITISGQGSTDPANAGVGITASETVVFSDGYDGSVTYFTSGEEMPLWEPWPRTNLCPRSTDPCSDCDGDYTNSTSFLETWAGTYFYVLTPGGDVLPVTFGFSHTIDWSKSAAWAWTEDEDGDCMLSWNTDTESYEEVDDFSISMGGTTLITYPTGTITWEATYPEERGLSVSTNRWWIGATVYTGYYGLLFTLPDEGHCFGYLKTVSDTSEDIQITHLQSAATKTDGSTARSYTYDIKNADWYSAAAPASIAFA